jgi:hypothetical protein
MRFLLLIINQVTENPETEMELSQYRHFFSGEYWLSHYSTIKKNRTANYEK